MAADRRFATFPNATPAAVLLNPGKNSRNTITVDKIQRAKFNILRFTEVLDEVIDTNHIIVEEPESTPQSSASNPVDALFNEVG